MEAQESWNEPLNLCKKKKPVAVVTPSSGVEDQKKDEEDKELKSKSEEGSAVGEGGREDSSMYSVIRSLAACEQGFLTAMYMGGLVNSNLIAGRSNPYYPAAIPGYPLDFASWRESSIWNLLSNVDKKVPTPLKPSAIYPKELSINVPKVDIKLPSGSSALTIPCPKSSPITVSSSSKSGKKSKTKWYLLANFIFVHSFLSNNIKEVLFCFQDIIDGA
jgi:hypothetical protein